MTNNCIYTKIKEDGYETVWKTKCKHTVVYASPEDVGFTFAPLPNAEGRKFCTYCGRIIKLDKEYLF